MEIKEQLEYRRKLIDDTVRFKPRERVPHISNFALWPVIEYGVPLSAACRDWDLYEKVQRHFMETYQFDVAGMSSTGAFYCNPPKMLDTIGTGYNIFNDAAGTVSLEDFDLLQAEDYDDLITNLPALVWNKLLPRKFERWAAGEVTIADFKTALEEYTRFINYMGRMSKITLEEYGLPSSFGYMAPMPGIELLVNNLRGFRGTSRDMRKIPDKLLEAIQSLEPSDEVIDNTFNQAPMSECYAFGAMVGLLANNFLSLSQWEKYEWPIVKKILDAAVKADTTVMIFAEGVISRFYEYFKDFPAGHIAIAIEQDDVFDFRENLPNVTVIGGMPTSLLGGATPEKCVSYAKHLCDELGKDGGFILSQDKMMSYLVDSRPENIKAVCDFVAEYTF